MRSELRLEMSQAIRQMIQVFLASRNWSDERNQQKLEKLKIGSCTKSIRNDLSKKGDMIFSEESSRVIYEMGNLELIKLRQTSATIQCRIGSYHSTKFGMVQPELEDVLLDTDFILFFVMVTKLDMVEFSTLENSQQWRVWQPEGRQDQKWW